MPRNPSGSTQNGSSSNSDPDQSPQTSNDAQNDPSKGGQAATDGNQSTQSATLGLTDTNTPNPAPSAAGQIGTTAQQDEHVQGQASADAALFAQMTVDGTLPEDPGPKDVAINKLREMIKRMPPGTPSDTILYGYGGVIFRTGDLKALFDVK